MSPSASEVGSVVIPLDVLNQVLKDLNMTVDADTFLDKLAEHSATRLAVLQAQSRKEAHIAAVTSLNKSTPLPTPAPGIVRRVDPSSVDPAIREKKRKLLEDTRAAFNNQVPTPYHVTCWTGRYDNLQFIMAKILISSDDGTDEQEFNELCMWDTGAQITMIPGPRINISDKGGSNAPEVGFVQG